MAIENVDMIPVGSSNVEAIGYDEEDQTLYVDFLDKGRGGSRYEYLDVPYEVFEEFQMAGSMGSFVWTNLKDVYEYSKIL